MVASGVVGAGVVSRLRQRDWRAALWWASPLVAPLVWMTANRLLAGHWMPNTGVAKSHFYLPGFDWAYWWSTVGDNLKQAVTRLFYADASPLVWPRAVRYLWLIGALRILWWARRERRWLEGALVIAAPFLLVLAVRM